MNNREAFRELVYDLKCFWDAICDIYSPLCVESQYDIPLIDFNVATYDEIQGDEEDMEKRLQIMPNDWEDYRLAKYLLRRMQYDLPRVEGAELDALEVSKDFMKPELIKKLGSGQTGQVYKSSWMGLQSATKVIKVQQKCNKSDESPNFLKEANLLAGLSHPNIIKFIGCGTDENLEESLHETMEDSKDLYLVMEYMEMSLGDFLKKQKKSLPYIVAIDIMYQIAKGMCYLHDMHVAHLDVKPDNVLLSSMKTAGVEGNCGHGFVKLMDYDTSKLEVQSKPELQKHPIGTPKYMAPEMRKEKKEDPPCAACPFQADVWSFAMTCSEILSLKKPFPDTKKREDILQKIRDHVRPDLPSNCEELTVLIEECWVEDPSRRPTFSNICERLTTLKKKFMIGMYSNDIPRFKKDQSTTQNMERKSEASKHVKSILATKKV
jgi:serine/threonine protein kinase